ncbi:MAG: bifunctional DNA primase/polymerase [Nitrososphaerota archaeon]
MGGEDEVKEFALFLFERGLTALPLAPNSKRPLIEDWTGRPRDELYNLFAKYNECNIGIRVERPLFIVDVDRLELLPLIEDELRSPTWKVRTRRGYHIYLMADRYPETNKRGRMIQLLADGCQVVAPPSEVEGHRYLFEMGPPDIEIATVDKRTVEKIEKIVDFLADGEALVQKFAEVWDEGHRHNLSLWLMGYFAKNSIPKAKAAVWLKAICLLAGDPELDDRARALKDTYAKPPHNIRGIRGLVSELSALVGAPRVKEFLDVLPVKPSEEAEMGQERRREYVFGGEVIDGKLVEPVETESGRRILLWDGNNYTIAEKIELGEVIYEPFREICYTLPKAPSTVSEDPGLWSETKRFIEEYYDVPNSDVYDVLTAVVAWSYFVNSVGASTPYILFLGPWRSGKTRGLEVLASLCYKALSITDPSEAVIFRLTEAFRPTLIIDEAHIINENVRALLAAGYRFGSKVPRVVDPEKPGVESVKFFDVFGLKIYASREAPPDDILTRSITIHCEKNLRQVRKRIDPAAAAGLRSRWLAQKLRMHGKVDVSFEEFQSEDGRIQELFSPLIVMAALFGGEEARAAVERYGREVEREVSGLEKATEEAELVEAVNKIVGNNSGDAPEVIEVIRVVEELNDKAWTPHRVGRKLSVMGFKKVRFKGKRGYEVDYPLLQRLARRYGIL